ncbi:ArsR/SmtB family transcription factor [Catellatospora methionotrophica]|uniref:ArsR/SmtB family transcription factor n=1 Tax=Catellatospora methionotrophica TaxID=121620 RepID=UPI0033E8BCAA
MAMDDVFKALADPSRRALLDSLNARNGQTLRELCGGLDMARQSVSKHLAVLEEANLVTTVWRGREKLHHLNAEPINAIADRWIDRYHRGRVHVLADLKTSLEQQNMDEFVYTTFIRTTPRQLWQAITDPAFTERYWQVTFDTDWQVGSTMTWERLGVVMADPAQVVLEAEPYTRLAYTWHTFTPAFAKSVDLDEDLRRQLAAEQRSKVSFDLEQVGDLVKLTVVHDGFAPGSVLPGMVGQGWPHLLSDLKTLLETGRTMAEQSA